MLKKIILASLTVVGALSVQAAENRHYACFSVRPDVPGSNDNWNCGYSESSEEEFAMTNPMYLEYKSKVDNILDAAASVHADIRDNDPMLELLYKDERNQADSAFNDIIRFYSIIQTITEEEKREKLHDLVNQLSEKKELEEKFTCLKEAKLQLLLSSNSYNDIQ